jgi:flagellar hook assembly protein FlgD
MENIRINIYDIKGNQIETVFSGLLAEGNYTFNWNGTNASTGVYIIKCESEKNSKIQKIFLVK